MAKTHEPGFWRWHSRSEQVMQAASTPAGGCGRFKFETLGSEHEELVIFLHAAGLSSWIWSDVIARLSGMGALLIDMPGHGQNRDTRWVSIDETARRLNALARAEQNGRRLHIAGLSMGSYVGLSMLADAPGLYDSATLSGFHAGGMPKRGFNHLVIRLMSPFLTTRFMARKTAQMLAGGDVDLDRFVEEATQARWQDVAKCAHEAIDFEAPTDLSAITSRVMIAAGSKEHSAILQSLDVFKARLSQCDTYVADGLGHGWPGQAPGQFADLLLRQVRG